MSHEKLLKTRVTWVAVCAIPVIFIGWFVSHIVHVTETKDEPKPSLATEANPSKSLSHEYPELHFTSASSIPMQLHGFQLGMSISEAIAIDSGLRVAPDHLLSVDSPNSVPYTRTSDGFPDVVLDFSNGRLILIMSSLDNVSPDDAAAFDENTKRRLGPPTVVLRSGALVQQWVWIDGDIRISYRDSSVGYRGPRILVMQMAIYPLLLKKEAPDTEFTTNAESVRISKHDFGGLPEVDAPKALPRSLGGLELRMNRSQLQSLMPNLVIKDYSERESRASFSSGDLETDIFLWDGLVETICHNRTNLSVNNFSRTRAELLQTFGTPVESHFGKGYADIDWEDQASDIIYIGGVPLIKESARGESRAWDKECLSDNELVNSYQQDHVLTYIPQRVPASRSFF